MTEYVHLKQSKRKKLFNIWDQMQVKRDQGQGTKEG